MQVIINENLGIRPYRKKQVQGLAVAHIIKSLQRYKKLLNWHSRECVDLMLFSDEKLLCTEQCYNAKSNVEYSAIFDDTPENLQTVKRFQNKNSVTV